MLNTKNIRLTDIDHKHGDEWSYEGNFNVKNTFNDEIWNVWLKFSVEIHLVVSLTLYNI
jgi:hypothetical protein